MTITIPADPETRARHAQIRAEIAEAVGQGPERARELLRRQLGEFDTELQEEPVAPEQPAE